MSNTRDVYTMHVLHMRINNFVILLSWKRTEHVKHFQSEHIYCCACVLRKCVMCLCVSVCVWVCVGVLCKQLIFIKEVVQNLLHACARHAVFSIPHPHPLLVVYLCWRWCCAAWKLPPTVGGWRRLK